MTELPRSQVDIPALTTFLDSLQSYSQYLVQVVEAGQLFYHYTDLNGLNGIVGHHDLWLTNSRYSNDDDEILHGYTVARRVVEQQLKSAARRRRSSEASRVDYLEALAGLIEEPPPEGFYICCFCEQDNLLGQWRSYGANGTGVSLGFDPMQFTYIAGADMPLGLMRLWRVFYKPSTQERIVRAAIDHAYATYAGQPVTDMAQRAADAIQFFVPTFKNRDFEEERERRLIFTPAPDCPVKARFRVARGMLAPYYSIRDLATAVYGEDWRLPLRSVTVGPSVLRSLNLASVQMLLAQYQYGDAEIGTSDTPYRG
jgi:hypothetical protein